MSNYIIRMTAAMAGSIVVLGGLIGARAAVGGSAAVTPAPPEVEALPGTAPGNPSATSDTPAAGGATPGGAAPSGAAPSGSAKDGTFTGAAARTRYGDVQVQIVVSGGRLTDVRVVKAPNRDREDQMINGYALPILISATIAAQSAQIDTVSGATYTSGGYIKSLQSAIDQAGL